MKPSIDDVVVQRYTSFRGSTSYGHCAEVQKIYKNGNVVLSGAKIQFNVAEHDQGYTLTPCGQRERGGTRYDLVTKEVLADIKRSEKVRELSDALYNLEKYKDRERTINHMSTGQLQHSINNINSVLETLNSE